MLDKVKGEMKEKIEYFLYADDLMVIGNSITAVKEFDKLIIKYSNGYKLIINSNKTETQYITKKKEKILQMKEELLKIFFP